MSTVETATTPVGDWETPESLGHAKELYRLADMAVSILRDRKGELELGSTERNTVVNIYQPALNILFEILKCVEGVTESREAKALREVVSPEGASRRSALSFSGLNWKSPENFKFLPQPLVGYDDFYPFASTVKDKSKSIETVREWATRLCDIGRSAQPISNKKNPAERTCWQSFWSGLGALLSSLFCCLNRKFSTSALLLRVHNEVTQPAQKVLDEVAAARS